MELCLLVDIKVILAFVFSLLQNDAFSGKYIYKKCYFCICFTSAIPTQQFNLATMFLVNLKYCECYSVFFYPCNVLYCSTWDVNWGPGRKKFICSRDPYPKEKDQHRLDSGFRWEKHVSFENQKITPQQHKNENESQCTHSLIKRSLWICEYSIMHPSQVNSFYFSIKIIQVMSCLQTYKKSLHFYIISYFCILVENAIFASTMVWSLPQCTHEGRCGCFFLHLVL